MKHKWMNSINLTNDQKIQALITRMETSFEIFENMYDEIEAVNVELISVLMDELKKKESMLNELTAIDKNIDIIYANLKANQALQESIRKLMY